MNVPAVVGAVIVSAAGRNALVAPFLAHEEGNGLRELGQVGAGTICADAFEGEIIRIAFVGLGTTLLDAGKLEANERAGLFLVETPFVCDVVNIGKNRAGGSGVYIPLCAWGTLSGSI